MNKERLTCWKFVESTLIRSPGPVDRNYFGEHEEQMRHQRQLEFLQGLHKQRGREYTIEELKKKVPKFEMYI